MDLYRGSRLIACTLFVHLVSAAPTIWPLPREFTAGTKTIAVCGTDFNFTTNLQSDALDAAIARFDAYLMTPTPILKTAELQNIEADGQLCFGSITVFSADETLSIDTNENYTLSIDADAVNITAETIYGAMFALTTLEQLIRYDPFTTTSNIIESAPWAITDYPVYRHRGVMIDPSRNFLSVALIKNVLDAMAMNKLNVLHIHLIDAQSFPFYADSHPELSEAGAYSQQKVYHPSNLTDIVSYAKRLGIRVIPELDTPGHTFAVQFSEPELMECVGVEDSVPAMCPEPPCGYLNVSTPKTYDLILDLFKDAYEIFPDSYFHVGADEVEDECWGENTTSKYTQWVSTMSHDVNFVGNKTPILWSGHLAGSIPIGQNDFDVVIQIWDNAEHKATALENGFKVIDSIYTSYYLDCGFGNWLTGGKSWCDPYKTWLDIYNHSLTEGVADEYLSGILGGEVCLWGEAVDENNLGPRLWPRAASAAERWWRDEALPMNELNEGFRRLAMQRDWMVHRGIIASPVQPEFCTLYPSYCDYYRDTIYGDVADGGDSESEGTETDDEDTESEGTETDDVDEEELDKMIYIAFGIGIGIGISVFVILVVVGCIWVKNRNLRKMTANTAHLQIESSEV